MTSEPRGRALGQRPRHVRRVTPEHVGQRVSVRRWAADPERGLVQADAVGRLVAWEPDDTLVVVDRDGGGTRLAATDVVSSRVVPEHPRMPPEPTDAGTRESPLLERIVRVLLVDDGHVLLRAPTDDGPRTAPGARLPRRGEPGAVLGALLQELLDDDPDATSAGDDRVAEIGDAVLERTTHRRVGSVWWETTEGWHLARLVATTRTVDPALAAWCGPEELTAAATDPVDLAERLARWRQQGTPSRPEPLDGREHDG